MNGDGDGRFGGRAAAGDDAAVIVRAWSERRDVPLLAPYVLSFVTLESVTARLVHVELADGRCGVGECVALPGYGCESDADVADAHAAWLPQLAGRTAGEARVWLKAVATGAAGAAGATGTAIGATAGGATESTSTSTSAAGATSGSADAATGAAGGGAERPFALGAALAALDVATGGIELPATIDHPLVAAIATEAPAAMLERVADLHGAGYRTIKVKFGRDAQADAACVSALLDGLPADVQLRFDANQAYTPEEAAAVLSAFDHPRRDRVELFEQPLGVDEGSWVAFRVLAAGSPVPLMLDESIETAEDVERAAEYGAAWIKLKQCKGAGVRELLSLAALAKSCGMRVILGNGVATDVANLFEAGVRAMGGDLFDGAGEECGFARLATPLLALPPRCMGGGMRWTGAARAEAAFALAPA